jgi:hypothetical protein
MNNLQDNLEFGEKMELEILPLLQKYFNDTTIRKNPNRKSVLDYLGNKPRELKSRRFASFQYSTTLLPINKVEMTQTLDKDFLFLFDNALGYITYNHEKFSKYTTKRIMGKHFDGDYEVECFLIPISHLTWIYKKCLLL